jgi:hypothetical protein
MKTKDYSLHDRAVALLRRAALELVQMPKEERWVLLVFLAELVEVNNIVTGVREKILAEHPGCPVFEVDGTPRQLIRDEPEVAPC